MSTSLPSAVPRLPARLLLESGHTRAGMLDGAWWPRSRDAEPELAALIAELTVQAGPIFRIALNHATWDIRPTRIVSGGRVIKVSWFGPSDLHAITITGDFPHRLDLLVVPPEASAGDAEAAMRDAGNPASAARATAILVAHGIDIDTGTRSGPIPVAAGTARTAALPVIGAVKPGTTNGKRPDPRLHTGMTGLGS